MYQQMQQMQQLLQSGATGAAAVDFDAAAGATALPALNESQSEVAAVCLSDGETSGSGERGEGRGCQDNRFRPFLGKSTTKRGTTGRQSGSGGG